MLYSGSFDTKIIVWDIGGGQGTYYELSGHRNKVRGLAFVEEADSLLSTGDDGMLVMWNMKAERQQASHAATLVGECARLWLY